MSDRPSAINGKRNRSWGSRDVCPACGQCLCFGCHPSGPCVDEAEPVPMRAFGRAVASAMMLAHDTLRVRPDHA